MQKNRRRNYIPNPSFQVQLVVICLFIAAGMGLMQGLLLQRFVTEVLQELPASSTHTRTHASVWIMSQFFISLAVIFPFILGFGILVSFRFAGPLVNIERHLRKIAAGEDPGPCRLRKGDQLHHIADALNLAVATLRGQGTKAAPGADAAATTVATTAEATPETVEQSTP